MTRKIIFLLLIAFHFGCSNTKKVKVLSYTSEAIFCVARTEEGRCTQFENVKMPRETMTLKEYYESRNESISESMRKSEAKGWRQLAKEWSRWE